MTHLDLDQLLALREPGTEPGSAEALNHLAGCATCRAELERLDQRVARLKALPSLRPSRDRWTAVQQQLAADRGARRRRGAVWGALGGLAMAASFAGAFVLAGSSGDERASLESVAGSEIAGELNTVKARSQALEAAIQEYSPESRVIDGRTDRVAEGLEIRIAELDRQLDATELAEDTARDVRLLRLWEERVGLLDALVDVHLTRASNVGL